MIADHFSTIFFVHINSFSQTLIDDSLSDEDIDTMDRRLFGEIGEESSLKMERVASTLELDRKLAVNVKGRDYFLDLLYCLLPTLIGIMIVSSLCCVFFYKEQLEKFGQQTAM